MAIKSTFKLENTDEVEATLALTMRLSEWKHLLAQLNGHEKAGAWPGWKVGRKIQTMINEAERRFSGQHEDED